MSHDHPPPSNPSTLSKHKGLPVLPFLVTPKEEKGQATIWDLWDTADDAHLQPQTTTTSRAGSNVSSGTGPGTKEGGGTGTGTTGTPAGGSSPLTSGSLAVPTLSVVSPGGTGSSAGERERGNSTSSVGTSVSMGNGGVGPGSGTTGIGATGTRATRSTSSALEPLMIHGSLSSESGRKAMMALQSVAAEEEAAIGGALPRRKASVQQLAAKFTLPAPPIMPSVLSVVSAPVSPHLEKSELQLLGLVSNAVAAAAAAAASTVPGPEFLSLPTTPTASTDHFTGQNRTQCLPDNGFFLAVMSLYWSNLVGPRMEQVWTPRVGCPDEPTLSRLAKQILNGEVMRTSDGVEQKIVALEDEGLLTISYLYTASPSLAESSLYSNTTLSMTTGALSSPTKFVLSFVVPLVYLDNFSSFFGPMDEHGPVLVEILQGLRQGVRLDVALSMFAEEHLVPFIEDIMTMDAVAMAIEGAKQNNHIALGRDGDHAFGREFIAQAITSHLQTQCSTVVVGNNITIMNMMINTLALFLSAEDRAKSCHARKQHRYIPDLFLQGIYTPNLGRQASSSRTQRRNQGATSGSGNISGSGGLNGPGGGVALLDPNSVPIGHLNISGLNGNGTIATSSGAGGSMGNGNTTTNSNISSSKKDKSEKSTNSGLERIYWHQHILASPYPTTIIDTTKGTVEQTEPLPKYDTLRQDFKRIYTKAVVDQSIARAQTWKAVLNLNNGPSGGATSYLHGPHLQGGGHYHSTPLVSSSSNSSLSSSSGGSPFFTTGNGYHGSTNNNNGSLALGAAAAASAVEAYKTLGVELLAMSNGSSHHGSHRYDGPGNNENSSGRGKSNGDGDNSSHQSTSNNKSSSYYRRGGQTNHWASVELMGHRVVRPVHVAAPMIEELVRCAMGLPDEMRENYVRQWRRGLVKRALALVKFVQTEGIEMAEILAGGGSFASASGLGIVGGATSSSTTTTASTSSAVGGEPSSGETTLLSSSSSTSSQHQTTSSHSQPQPPPPLPVEPQLPQDAFQSLGLEALDLAVVLGTAEKLLPSITEFVRVHLKIE